MFHPAMFSTLEGGSSFSAEHFEAARPHRFQRQNKHENHRGFHEGFMGHLDANTFNVQFDEVLSGLDVSWCFQFSE